MLVLKVLQKRTWQEAARQLDVSGRAKVIEALRHALRRLVLHYGDASTRAEAERLSQPNGNG